MNDSRKPVVLVGYIDREDGCYPTGECKECNFEFLNNLKLFCQNPVLRRRSFHVCAVCNKTFMEYSNYYQYNNINICASNADIIVPSKKEKFYLSPVQIYHYVRDHNYLPPAEFVEAVIDMADIDISFFLE